jgi:signal peptidase I
LEYKVVIITLLSIFLLHPSSTNAQLFGTDEDVQEAYCSTSINHVESFFDISEGTYVVRVIGDVTQIQAIYFTDENKSCKQIDLNAGSDVQTTSSSVHILQIVYNDSYSGSEKPSILLSSKKDDKIAGCSSISGCPYEYDGELMSLYPRRISSYFDNADIYFYDDMSSASISSVKYAIDSKVIYEKDVIEPFNRNFVPPGDRTLQTKVEFSNGLYGVRDEKIKTGTFADVYLLTRSWLFQNSILLLYPMLLALALALVIGFQKIRVWRHEKKIWRSEHLANTEESRELLDEGHVIKEDTDETLQYVGGVIKKPLIAVVVVMALVTFSARFGLTFVRTDGESMIQTLQNNQQMLVNRSGRSLASLRSADYIPNRGDIVIFERTSEGAVGEKSLLVKRVIGLPGDTIEVQDEKVIVRYEVEGKAKEYVDAEQPWYQTVNKSLFNGRISVTLGVGELFVMGDNRDGSIDSRFFGPITASSIYGRVLRPL